MTPPLIAVLTGAACFVAHAMLSLILLRLPGRASPVERHAASAASTHLLGTIASALAFGPLPYWPIAAASGFGVPVWLFAYSAVYKSVSLRILRILHESRETDFRLMMYRTSSFSRNSLTASVYYWICVV